MYQDFNLLQRLEHGHAPLKRRLSLAAQHLHTTGVIPPVPRSISVPEGHTIDPQVDYVTCWALADPCSLPGILAAKGCV